MIAPPAPMTDPDLAELPLGWLVQGRCALSDADATTALAHALAPLLRPGDTLLLQGQLGAGKSHFARAMIRALIGPGGESAEVPSPSFTLVQTYDTRKGEVWHADLYRLSDPQEVIELGLDLAMEEAICLIEWPDRIAPDWPSHAVCLRLDAPRAAPDTRIITLIAPNGSDLALRLLPVLVRP
jgi:tRNA threonylcarbamoyladenosine biosynthesis protein TsaE